MPFEHSKRKSRSTVLALFVFLGRAKWSGGLNLETIDLRLVFLESSGNIWSFGFFERRFGHGVVGFAEFKVILEFSEEEVSLAVRAILILKLPVEKLVFIMLLLKAFAHVNAIHAYYYFIESLVKEILYNQNTLFIFLPIKFIFYHLF